MPEEPAVKRVIAFFDGQNLFHMAKLAFGYDYPNYDPGALSRRIATENGWDLVGVRFYTGIPDEHRNPFWHHFWSAKLANMGRQKIWTFRRTLRYHAEAVTLSDGTITTVSIPQEKGIDVRLALDVVRLALDGSYDVALMFSQDQDLSEVADEIKAISRLQDRWIERVSAFPVGPGTKYDRGINGTKWIKIDSFLYDSCLDPNDYRPKPRR